MPQGPAAPGADLVVQVQEDCHADVRRHFLPDYGRVWHRHRSNCQEIVVQPDDYGDDEYEDDDFDDDGDRTRDCHRELRRHYLPEYGARVTHRHAGSRCRIVEEEDDEGRDCHRDVRRHLLPEYGGSVTHRHVGPNCRIRAYRRSDDRDSGGNCLRLGPILYCED